MMIDDDDVDDGGGGGGDIMMRTESRSILGPMRKRYCQNAGHYDGR